MIRFPLSSISLWFAAAACWSVPFLVASHTYPIPTFYSEFAGAICWVVLAVFVLGTSWREKVVFPVGALAPVALALVILVQLIVATPVNPFYSFAAIAFLLAAAAAIGLGARCRGIPGALRAVAIGVLAGGMLTVAIELLQLFRVPGLPDILVSIAPTGLDRRMWGNLNQPNHVASYLGFSLAACVYLLNRAKVLRVVLAACVLMLLIGMALTFSRTAWIHIGIVGVLTGLLAWNKQPGARKGWAIAIPVLLLLAYQGCNWLLSYASALWDLGLPTSLAARMEHGVSDRMPIWRHAWHMFMTSPWLGGGWGDYAWNQYVQTDVLGPVLMSLNAHNAILDLLAKAGILGLLAVLLPLVGLVRVVLRTPFTSAQVFMYTAILVTSAHSMLEYPLHYLFFLLPFAFALGYVDDRPLRFPSADMAWTLTGVVAVCGAVLTGRLWVDYKPIEQFYYQQGDARGALQRYQANKQLLLVPYANLSIANNALVTYELAPVLAAIEHQAVQFYPSSGPVQRWAVALALQGKTDEAVLQVRRLRDEYSGEYAGASPLITHVCKVKMVGLTEFCARLKTEHLLVNVD
ncbi:Wzy polymerase domain-containing protein [Ralstonia sp. CHL-2022]|uniref:Wzy polymerase domain-containing protein n=1 Tax=Ralstonia mojiangensis TaxID=2953895 RepID=A0ABT2L4H9_9RALS|nr:O-antigen ligase family protein [Ralstonia mojiangensis]MCT7295827.1 Wzy polymerase domain-containing protein [Ralstonia mojiangensis]MCT7310300.1 Wzy polymerase domain-containing protein [Ralstonia mojiangensis]